MIERAPSRDIIKLYNFIFAERNIKGKKKIFFLYIYNNLFLFITRKINKKK